jgi:superfamily II DNA or RNA helicase
LSGPLAIISKGPSELIVRGGQELANWRQSIAVRAPGYKYSPSFKKGHWDGYTRVGKWMRQISPGIFELAAFRGLMPALQAAFPGAAARDIPVPPLRVEIPDSLRDYQADVLRQIQTHRWGRISFATNAGKGAIIALAAKGAVDSGMRVLILCDEVSVFNALKEEVQKWSGLDPHLVEAGRPEPPPTEGITLAMIPTLVRRLSEKKPEDKDKVSDRSKRWRKWLEGVQMLLLDEADKGTADTWKSVMKAAKNTVWRIGFSGTWPAEGTVEHLVLEEMMGPILLRVRNKELVERGISARPTIVLCAFEARFPKRPDGFFDLAPGAQRQWVFDHGVILNEDRHRYIDFLRIKDAQNAIIINRVAHGEQLQRFIEDAVFLDGSAPKEVREDVLERFGRGGFQNLITTKILDRGSNKLGKVVGLIFASAEGSGRQTLQRLGRGLRRGEGKEYLFTYDIIDRGHRYLEEGAKRRIRLYNDEGFEMEVYRARR